MFTNRGEKIDKPVLLNEDYTLSVDYLIRLMDSLDVRIDYEADKSSAEIGEVIVFIRTFSDNLVLSEKSSGKCLFTCNIYNKEGKPCVPSMMTLNDFVMVMSKSLIKQIYDKAEDPKLALSAFPTPFGVMYDPEKKCNVAIIQLCADHKNLGKPNDKYEFIPFEMSSLESYVKSHLKRTK